MKVLIPIIAMVAVFGCSKNGNYRSATLSLQISSDSRAQGHESFPMEYLAFNECTNEWVVVSLVIEYKYNYFETKDDFHAKAVSQVKDGKGVGVTSGKTYKLVGHSLDVEKFMNYQTTENQTFRVTSKLTFINPGGKDWVTESVRIRRVADDGTIIIDTEEETSLCK